MVNRFSLRIGERQATTCRHFLNLSDGDSEGLADADGLILADGEVDWLADGDLD